MICAIPLRRAAVLAELIADILDAAKYREQFLPRSLLLPPEGAGGEEKGTFYCNVTGPVFRLKEWQEQRERRAGTMSTMS